MFLMSKLEPEDMGPEDAIVGEGRGLTHGVLEATSVTAMGAVLWHQPGRHETDTNIRPPCFNASAAGPLGPGSYAACRAQGWASLMAASSAGLVQVPGVSNYQVRLARHSHSEEDIVRPHSLGRPACLPLLPCNPKTHDWHSACPMCGADSRAAAAV
jgi:diketogulonate reductase-like aldo/keto reductase